MLAVSDKDVEARMYWITASDIHAEIRRGSLDVGVMLEELTTLVAMSDWPMLRGRAQRLRAATRQHLATVRSKELRA